MAPKCVDTWTVAFFGATLFLYMMRLNKILSARGALVTAGLLASGSCGGALGPEDLGRIEVAAGNNQEVSAGTAVPTPPAVRALSDDGRPVPGVVVTFVVTDGGGTLTGAEATSNADGIAAVTSWTLGPEVGSNVLNATAPGATERAVFLARGLVGPPSIVEKLLGDGQTVTAGLPVPVVPTVRVTDQFGNVVTDLQITFTAATGGGSVVAATATTDGNGEADAGSWTLGGAPGPNTLSVTAGEATATFEGTGTPGPVALALCLRLLLLGVWLRGEMGEEARPSNSAWIGFFIGLAIFEKLSSVVLVLTLPFFFDFARF